MRGPLFNNIVSRVSTRDNLGIKGPYTSISRRLCEIVNTVTPTPFYWCFLAWIYYDAHENARIGLNESKKFFNYLKRQDYFFIVASLLYANDNGTDIGPVVGKDNVLKTIKLDATYYEYDHERDEKYYSAQYGGMNYYPAGLETSGMFVDKSKKLPNCGKDGRDLALAFEKVIKHTEYYKTHRMNDNPVPREVLLEYAKCINIKLDGFDECKKILRDVFFNEENRANLCSCRDYVNYINRLSPDPFKADNLRKIIFEKFSPKGSNLPIPEQLSWIAKSWEIVQGREYFTLGIEIIWKQLTNVLNGNPMDKATWINETIEMQKSKDILNIKVGDFLKKCNYEFETREKMISISRKDETLQNYELTNGLGIMLESYNRFYNREDFNEIQKEFLEENEDSISLSDWFKKVAEYKDATVEELLRFIMANYCIEQHYKTAISKLDNRPAVDGFYYELSEENIYFHKQTASVDFQGNRLIQLYSVMKYLDMIEV